MVINNLLQLVVGRELRSQGFPYTLLKGSCLELPGMLQPNGSDGFVLDDMHDEHGQSSQLLRTAAFYRIIDPHKPFITINHQSTTHHSQPLMNHDQQCSTIHPLTMSIALPWEALAAGRVRPRPYSYKPQAATCPRSGDLPGDLRGILGDLCLAHCPQLQPGH